MRKSLCSFQSLPTSCIGPSRHGSLHLSPIEKDLHGPKMRNPLFFVSPFSPLARDPVKLFLCWSSLLCWWMRMCTIFTLGRFFPMTWHKIISFFSRIIILFPGVFFLVISCCWIWGFPVVGGQTKKTRRKWGEIEYQISKGKTKPDTRFFAWIPAWFVLPNHFWF